jgi:hypothetical protein
MTSRKQAKEGVSVSPEFVGYEQAMECRLNTSVDNYRFSIVGFPRIVSVLL